MTKGSPSKVPVVSKHVVAEVVARKLHGIEGVPKAEQKRMASHLSDRLVSVVVNKSRHFVYIGLDRKADSFIQELNLILPDGRFRQRYRYFRGTSSQRQACGSRVWENDHKQHRENR